MATIAGTGTTSEPDAPGEHPGGLGLRLSWGAACTALLFAGLAPPLLEVRGAAGAALLGLTPALAAAFLARRRREGLAWLAFVGAGSLGLCLAGLELRVRAVAGVGGARFLALSGAAQGLAWAGGAAEAARGSALLLSWCTLVTLIGAAAGSRLARLSSRRSLLLLPLAGLLGLLLGDGPPARALGARVASAPRSEGQQARFRAEVGRLVEPVLARSHPRLCRAQASDTSARVEGERLPNLVLVVAESLRASALNPKDMPRLDAWSRRGLRLARHYAGSNRSELGLFCLLYGRHGLSYDATLDAGLQPQVCSSLRRSGYAATFVSSQDTRHWKRMGEFLDGRAFDTLVFAIGGLEGPSWPARDREVVDRVLEAASAPGPALIVAYLVSSHYPYFAPPPDRRHMPAPHPLGSMLEQRPGDRPRLLNRYLNAVGFLDRELDRLLAGLDLDRNVVVVTSDHGESLWEDGTLAHSSRASETQTRVPCFAVGKGVPRRSLDWPTSHVDLLPTLFHLLASRGVRLAGAHGRDLLDAGLAPEPVVQSGFEWPPRHHAFVLFSPERRLAVTIGRSRPELEIEGSLDALGNLAATDLPPLQEAGLWADRIRVVVESLTR